MSLISIKKVTYVALLGILTMVTLNLYPSWSQYARSLEEPLFLITMQAMGLLFVLRALTHITRYWRVIGQDIQQRHMDIVTGLLFFGIVATPVTHPSVVIQVFHFIFTILAIIIIHTQIIIYCHRHEGQPWRMLSIFGAAVAVAGMAMGFFTDWITLGVGELLAATAPAVYVLLREKS
jgi:hypothetical protein